MILDENGIYLSVAVGSDCYSADRACEGAIETAYRAWHLDGRNSIVTLTLLCGDEMTIAASLISEYVLSTPAGRARNRAIHLENERAQAETKREGGWSPGSDE